MLHDNNSSPNTPKTWEVRGAIWIGKVLMFVPALAIMMLITPILFTKTWFTK